MALLVSFCMITLQKFLMGFVHAAVGLVKGFSERNMKFHGMVTVLVLLFGWILRLSSNEWMIILILIGAVWSAELVNSSIEELSNLVRDTQHLSYVATKKVRDMAAGSVLIMAIVAAMIGLIIFVPKLLILFS